MWNRMEYYEQDKLYYVIRYYNEKKFFITPFSFKSESTVINYIMAHGLDAIKISSK